MQIRMVCCLGVRRALLGTQRYGYRHRYGLEGGGRRAAIRRVGRDGLQTASGLSPNEARPSPTASDTPGDPTPEASLVPPAAVSAHVPERGTS